MNPDKEQKQTLLSRSAPNSSDSPIGDAVKPNNPNNFSNAANPDDFGVQPTSSQGSSITNTRSDRALQVPLPISTSHKSTSSTPSTASANTNSASEGVPNTSRSAHSATTRAEGGSPSEPSSAPLQNSAGTAITISAQNFGDEKKSDDAETIDPKYVAMQEVLLSCKNIILFLTAASAAAGIGYFYATTPKDLDTDKPLLHDAEIASGTYANVVEGLYYTIPPLLYLAGIIFDQSKSLFRRFLRMLPLLLLTGLNILPYTFAAMQTAGSTWWGDFFTSYGTFPSTAFVIGKMLERLEKWYDKRAKHGTLSEEGYQEYQALLNAHEILTRFYESGAQAVKAQKIAVPYYLEYDLELMSNLPNKDMKKAISGKIYVSSDTRTYVVRDSNGVQEGSLPEEKDSGIDLSNLSIRLNDLKLKNLILAVTSKAGHTHNLTHAQTLEHIQQQATAKPLFPLQKRDVRYVVGGTGKVIGTVVGPLSAGGFPCSAEISLNTLVVNGVSLSFGEVGSWFGGIFVTATVFYIATGAGDVYKAFFLLPADAAIFLNKFRKGEVTLASIQIPESTDIAAVFLASLAALSYGTSVVLIPRDCPTTGVAGSFFQSFFITRNPYISATAVNLYWVWKMWSSLFEDIKLRYGSEGAKLRISYQRNFQAFCEKTDDLTLEELQQEAAIVGLRRAVEWCQYLPNCSSETKIALEKLQAKQLTELARIFETYHQEWNRAIQTLPIISTHDKTNPAIPLLQVGLNQLNGLAKITEKNLQRLESWIKQAQGLEEKERTALKDFLFVLNIHQLNQFAAIIRIDQRRVAKWIKDIPAPVEKEPAKLAAPFGSSSASLQFPGRGPIVIPEPNQTQPDPQQADDDKKVLTNLLAKLNREQLIQFVEVVEAKKQPGSSSDLTLIIASRDGASKQPAAEWEQAIPVITKAEQAVLEKLQPQQLQALAASINTSLQRAAEWEQFVASLSDVREEDLTTYWKQFKAFFSGSRKETLTKLNIWQPQAAAVAPGDYSHASSGASADKERGDVVSTPRKGSTELLATVAATTGKATTPPGSSQSLATLLGSLSGVFDCCRSRKKPDADAAKPLLALPNRSDEDPPRSRWNCCGNR